MPHVDSPLLYAYSISIGWLFYKAVPDAVVLRSLSFSSSRANFLRDVLRVPSIVFKFQSISVHSLHIYIAIVSLRHCFDVLPFAEDGVLRSGQR